MKTRITEHHLEASVIQVSTAQKKGKLTNEYKLASQLIKVLDEELFKIDVF